MPIVFGILLDLNTTSQVVDGTKTSLINWGPLFMLLAGMYLASGIFWLFIDCNDSLETETL